MAAVERHFTRRIAAVRQAITESEDYDEAGRRLLTLAARWTPDALAALVAQMLELAALEGREAVFAGRRGPAFAEWAFGRQEFGEQIEFLRQKRGKPTRAWTDAMHGDHDRAFVVAGVTDMTMLEEFHAAVIDGAQSYDIKAFAAEFDRIVEKYGWSYNGGREWRIRTILETNIRTSHMAGRLAQMRDPDIVRARPFWRYIHGESRTPLNPRPEHVAWDGLVLPWNDPWWNTHYPPNGWKCSCGVEALSQEDLDRLGKAGPDQAPAMVRRIESRRDGQQVELVDGIEYGWDYQPGNLWERGLVPSRLINDPDNRGSEGRNLVTIDTPTPIADLITAARPFKATPLAEGLASEDYVEAFLQPFGATLGKAMLWTDAAGTRITISEELFRAHDGSWKLHKRGRDIYTAMLAEAIMDPDEIWLGLREKPLDAFPGYADQVLTRRYIRADPDTGAFAVFDLGRRSWEATTVFAPRNRSKPDFAYLHRQRAGKLLWKRK